MGYLGYNPATSNSPMGDHFLVAIGMDGDTLLVHDPAGYPCAVISWDQFCAAWRAEGIAYRRGTYTLRNDFRRVREMSRAMMLRHTLPLARQNALRRSDETAIRGPEAVRRFAQDLRGKVGERIRAHLVWFALPLGARRCLDGARFLAEAGLARLAENFELQARLLGRTQSDAVARRWDSVAGAMLHLADLEEQFVEGIRAL
jgi:hypothetical protein